MLHAPTSENKTGTESSRTQQAEPEMEIERKVHPFGLGWPARQSLMGSGESATTRFGQRRVQLTKMQQAYGNQAVLRMMGAVKSPTVTASPLSQSGVLQRKCACGNSVGLSGTCAECQEKGEESLLTGIQTKLRVSQPGDLYEQEADRIADQVMGMPEPRIQRICPECEEELQRQPMEEEEEEEETLQTKPLAEQITPLVHRQTEPMEEEEEEEMLQTKTTPDKLPTVSSSLQNQIIALQGGGQPLPHSERAFFEPRFGYDFSQVRIHDYSRAADIASSIHARAFTIGNSIVFSKNQYNPSSREGKKLIAHELVHIIQQKGQSLLPLMRTCDCSDPHEYPRQDLADYFQTRFPHLQVGTYCLTEYPHNRYNCYGLSVGADRIVSEREIVEDYGRRTYRSEDSITYDDLDSFFISRGYIPQGYWHNASIVAYGTRTTPKHVAVKTDRVCNNTVLYDSKLGKDGPRITHYLYQLEGNFYGGIQRGYIRGRLIQTPTYPTRIPYRLPVRQISFPSLKSTERLLRSSLTKSDYSKEPSLLPEITLTLKIVRYFGSQSIPSRDWIRNVFRQCGIRIRFDVLPSVDERETHVDLVRDTTLNIPRIERDATEIQAILQRIRSIGNNEVPVAFVENILDHRGRSPAGRTAFGRLCAISNHTTYPDVVLAHEVGHYFLGSGHTTNPRRLMFGMPNRQSTELSPEECRRIRSAVSRP